MNEYIIVGAKTILFLLIILIIIRIMGKRELGELNVFDIIISFMISEIFSNALSDIDSNLFLDLLPIFIIFIVQIIISFIVLKSFKIRTFIESKPAIIINKGKIDYHEMKKQRYNTSDLLLQIREKGIENILEIDYAILEINGSLSIIKKNDSIYKYPLPIIYDSNIDKQACEELKISDEYIENELKLQGLKKDDVLLAFLSNNQKLIFFPKK